MSQKPSVDLQTLGMQGLAFHQKRNFAEAEKLYRQVLALDPGNFNARYLLGVIRHEQGRHAEALDLIAATLRINPNLPNVLSNYGLVLAALGRCEEALVHYDRALAIKPDLPETFNNRGNTLQQLKRFDEALASYDRALALRPDFYGALNNRGNTLQQMERLDEALADYTKALAIRPDFTEAWNNLGNTLRKLKRYEDALVNYDKAIAINPGFVMAWNNRGIALSDLGRYPEALTSFDRALAIQPDYADAWNNRGNALQCLLRFDEALAAYDRALAVKPDYAEAWSNRGRTLWQMKRQDEALASYSRAIEIKPDYAEALSNRGNMLWAEYRRFDEAVEDLEKAVRIDPFYEYARGDLLHLRMHGGDWRGLDAELARIDKDVRAGERVVRPFVYQAVSDSPADLQACATIHADHRFPATPALWTGGTRRHKKIRLGYLSGEFRAQATAYLMAGLYERHDKDRFEIIAFDNGWSDESPTRKRLESAFDKFVNISKLADRAAAERVLDEETDILINLNGYFGEFRMHVFAARPAPIQVNYLGFPGTLGARYIDYMVADRFVIPENERQFYTEKIVYLPDTYQVNDSQRAMAQSVPSRAECRLPEGAFVFCSFNQSYKLTPSVFAAWMNILRQVEGSVLWLLETNKKFPESLRRAAEGHGVSGERIVFAPTIRTDEHLARMKLADLFLDTLPCNSHTTASDALWTGLPLVTCRGGAFSGRVAESVLHAIGVPELVTRNLEEYEALALKLARDPELLESIRRKIVQNRLTAPLFDTDRYRRHLESAYTTMWEIFQRGEDIRSFAVEPNP